MEEGYDGDRANGWQKAFSKSLLAEPKRNEARENHDTRAPSTFVNRLETESRPARS